MRTTTYTLRPTRQMLRLMEGARPAKRPSVKAVLLQTERDYWKKRALEAEAKATTLTELVAWFEADKPRPQVFFEDEAARLYAEALEDKQWLKA